MVRIMANYGYAGVSTTDQDLSIQEDALRAAGCDIASWQMLLSRCMHTLAAYDRYTGD
jgi:hypothetical protein